MKKQLEKYIQFAIDNWFKLNCYYWFKIECNLIKFLDRDNCTYWNVNIIETITLKDFLEAIVIGLNKKDIAPYWIDEITIKQAMAIRDLKLEEFVEELLTN